MKNSENLKDTMRKCLKILKKVIVEKKNYLNNVKNFMRVFKKMQAKLKQSYKQPKMIQRISRN